MELHQRLKLAREEIGKSQKLLADELGIGLRSWQGYENGTNVPGGSVLEALARIGININWLLTGEGELQCTVNLSESDSHMALRARLLGFIYSGFARGVRDDCSQHGIDYEILRKYTDGDYLPTDEELRCFCEIAGGWDFKKGIISSKNGMTWKDFEKISKGEMTYELAKKVDLDLLKFIVAAIGNAIKETPIVLSLSKKSKLISIVYDDAINSEDRAGTIIDEVARLLNLICEQ